MDTTLSGVLPAGDRNGFDAISEALLNRPDQAHMVVMVVQRSKVTSHSDGRVVVTAKITDVEACPYGDPTWSAARRLLDQLHETRTGKVPLPLE